jgi:hypothetical protein
MDVAAFLDGIPLAGVLLGTLLCTFLAIEVGFLMGKWRRRGLPPESTVRTGPLAPASLGLLAFMLAMVFSAVSARFNELKHIGLDEANAIGTAFIRADLLDSADRAKTRHLLDDYVALRIEAVQDTSKEQIEEAIAKSEAIQGELWSTAVANALRQPTPTAALVVQSLNDVIDMHENRITFSLHYRLPWVMWTMLYSLAILAMGIGGYDTGLSGSSRVTAITLSTALAFSVVFVLVISFDRPHRHMSRTTHDAMMDVQEDIRSSMQAEPQHGGADFEDSQL